MDGEHPREAPLQVRIGLDDEHGGRFVRAGPRGTRPGVCIGRADGFGDEAIVFGKR
jgi:hypothetical protein